MKKFVSILLTLLLLSSMTAFAEENHSISIQASDMFVYVGKKITLSATVEQTAVGSVTKAPLIWSSSNNDIAVVDAKGSVKGINAGTATITCALRDDERIFASVDVEVRVAVKTITLSHEKITLLLGAGEELAQLQLGYQIEPDDAYEKTIRFTSSDETIATVDGNGFICAVAPGKAVISAKSNDAAKLKAATCIVTVGQAVESIAISEQTVSVEKGRKYKATVSVLPKDALNKGLIWVSSNEDIVRVDAKGTITAIDTGSAAVTCTAADGGGAVNSYHVTVYQAVTKITSKIKRVVLFQDKSFLIPVTVSPADATNRTLIWSSSKPIIASVESNGTVKAQFAGETVITAVAADGSGKKITFKVIVEPANPISLESLGFGIYIPNLLALTVENRCKSKTIADFNFDMELYSYNGSIIDEGSYSLGKATSIGAQRTKTIKRTVFGAGYATKVVITITGVTFSDGSYYSIPDLLQDTWSFRR